VTKNIEQTSKSIVSRPIVWSIAASDSGGGAGIQADLNTLHSLECHGCTIITAITAQNSLAVEKIHPIAAVDLAAQWQALEKDLPPKAIKIGLLPEPSTLRWLVRHLDELRLKQDFFCVWDPVLKASTGARFLDAFDRGEIDPLLQSIDLITPNLSEAEMLTKIKIQSYADVELAAKQLIERGAKNVLIKGGHSFSDSENAICRDYFISSQQSNHHLNLSSTNFWLSHKRQDQPNNHGTGCTLASAIASFIALDHSLSDSIVLGNRFIQQSLRLAAHQGQGAGPVWQAPLQSEACDLAILNKSISTMTDLSLDLTSPEANSEAFKTAEDLGLYAIIDNLIDLERLITQEVDTLQWRDKSSNNRETLLQAITLCKFHKVPLYINDDWQLALEFNAYGIHLGQEDLAQLEQKDIKRIQKQGIRLGISCHNETELAYAHSLQPSYLAFGPVFSPKSKIVNHKTIGLNKLRHWQTCYGALYPTTCIGGIDQSNLASIIKAGMKSIAVISALNNNNDGQAFIKVFKSTIKANK
jgi:hydroxymethylpyrimidine kinase/phosphomethylpyrimidine kinase/thiamine-phosphate diphosphorylase